MIDYDLVVKFALVAGLSYLLGLWDMKTHYDNKKKK